MATGADFWEGGATPPNSGPTTPTANLRLNMLCFCACTPRQRRCRLSESLGQTLGAAFYDLVWHKKAVSGWTGRFRPAGIMTEQGNAKPA